MVIEIEINKKLIKYNFSKRQENKIKYIVIHDTANTDVGSGAENHYLFFNGQDRQASAHYFIDDKQILQIVDDENRSWHCGDGYGEYGITNENSIGVEMCINSDGDFNKTYEKTLWLVKYLIKKYNLSIDNVVRHYDASRKICPNIWKNNNWEKWYKFKDDLKQSLQDGFISSDEFENVNRDYVNVIRKIYKNLFQRDVDDEGLKYWNSRILDGLSIGEMLNLMSESDEFKELYLR